MSQVEKVVQKGLQTYLTLDNWADRSRPNVTDWIKRRKDSYRHFTPTSESWPILAEHFYSTLTKKQPRRGIFHPVHHLETYLTDRNETHN